MRIVHKKKGKKGLFAIKIDLSKSYDKVSWECIWQVLKEANMPDELLKLIMHTVTSTELNVNSHIIEHEVTKRSCKAINMGVNGPKISHLMFADDLLLFGEATEDQMNCVMTSL
ncbi:unnamed protein product [Lathyrus sativus]|nr:unnamed protein product [Lathyrus sativus]